MEGRENRGYFDFDFFEKLHSKKHFGDSSVAEKFTAAETKFSLRQNCHKNDFLGVTFRKNRNQEIEESAVFTPFQFVSAFRWYPRIVYPTIIVIKPREYWGEGLLAVHSV